jgi:hypothetical protein
MAMPTLIAVVPVIAVVVGAIAAVIGVRQTKRQADRVDSSTPEAVESASRLATDEASRALGPQYDVAIQAPDGCTDNQAPDLLHLLVTFTGPADLDHLDRLVVVLDPDRLPARRRAPYRFRPGTRPRVNDSGADGEGFVSRCQRVEGGEPLLFLLERTAPANWRGRLAVSLDAYRLGSDLDLPSAGPGTLLWSRALVLSIADVAR